MNWLVLSSPADTFPPRLLSWFLERVLCSGDLVHSIGKTHPSATLCASTSGSYPKTFQGWQPKASWAPGRDFLVLLFHDGQAIELDLAWATFGSSKLYGVLYDTGVFLAGIRSPAKMGACRLAKYPRPIEGVADILLDYQSIYLPVHEGHASGTWSDWLGRYIDPSVAAHAEKELGLQSGAVPELLPGVRLYSKILIRPGCPTAMDDLLAGLRANHLSKVAILDAVPIEAEEALDSRVTIIEHPPGS